MNREASRQLPTPTLMRGARAVYARAIRLELERIGVGDLPRSAAFLLAGMDSCAGPRAGLPRERGVSKQAVSQTIDLLVDRGYLERQQSREDRRRIELTLTPPGRQVVEAIVRAVESVDDRLRQLVSPEQVGAMRAALAALAEVEWQAGSSPPVSRPSLGRLDPIFRVSSLAEAMEHYRRLGFSTSGIGQAPGWAEARWEGVRLLLGEERGKRSAAAAYLYVEDAEQLYAQWSGAGVGGTTGKPTPTRYGRLEGWHRDPDGNAIRFSSPLAPQHRLRSSDRSANGV